MRMRKRTALPGRARATLAPMPGGKESLSRTRVLDSRSAPPQPKLGFSQPHDRYEQEADRVAERVTRMPEARVQARGGERQSIRAKPAGGPMGQVGSGLAAQLGSLSGGRPLPQAVRDYFEPRLGHDFGQVRVHDDARAAVAAQAVRARALTMGREVLFGEGQYAPASTEGQRLLAHELTHVIQQGQAGGMETRAAGVAREPRGAGRRGGVREPVAVTQRARGAVQAKWSDKWGLVGFALGAIGGLGLGFAAGAIAGAVLGLATLPLIGAMIVGALVGLIVGGFSGTLLGGFLGDRPVRCGHGPIKAAAKRATPWLVTAIRALRRYVGGYPRSLHEKRYRKVRGALKRHFHSAAGATAGHVLRTLGRILGKIRPWTRGRRRNPRWVLSPECRGRTDPECVETGAHASPWTGRVTFCRSFFGGSREWQAAALIHEIAHTLPGLILRRGRVHRIVYITDPAYGEERMYQALTAQEALRNAESYSHFAWEMGTGRVPSGPPRDRFRSCRGWRGRIRRAVATAEIWNKNADRACRKREGRWRRRRWSALGRWVGFPGVATAAGRRRACRVFAKVKRRMRSPISFECHRRGGGRCGRRRGRHWYWLPRRAPLHLCPAWWRPQTSDALAKSMLAGLYGYLGGVGNAVRRRKYARLAVTITRSYGYWETPVWRLR